MKINLYFEEGPGAQEIRDLISHWITSIGNRLGVNTGHISVVGVAPSDTYGEAISDLFGNCGFTNNDGHVSVGKTSTTFEGMVPKHTILLNACVFSMILGGINDSNSNNVLDWKSEAQLGPFIIAHELGHCRDNELNRWLLILPLKFPCGFDLNLVHTYYLDLLITEIGACLQADHFYSKELFKHVYDNECDSFQVYRHQLEYAQSQDVDNAVYNVALTGSAIIWVYLIQISKIIIGKMGTSFESEHLNRPFANFTGVELLHPRISDVVSSLCNTFPHGIRTFKSEIDAIWEDMSVKFGISFFKNAEGWNCHWIPLDRNIRTLCQK